MHETTSLSPTHACCTIAVTNTCTTWRWVLVGRSNRCLSSNEITTAEGRRGRQNCSLEQIYWVNVFCSVSGNRKMFWGRKKQTFLKKRARHMSQKRKRLIMGPWPNFSWFECCCRRHHWRWTAYIASNGADGLGALTMVSSGRLL